MITRLVAGPDGWVHTVITMDAPPGLDTEMAGMIAEAATERGEIEVVTRAEVHPEFPIPLLHIEPSAALTTPSAPTDERIIAGRLIVTGLAQDDEAAHRAANLLSLRGELPSLPAAVEQSIPAEVLSRADAAMARRPPRPQRP